LIFFTFIIHFDTYDRTHNGNESPEETNERTKN